MSREKNIILLIRDKGEWIHWDQKKLISENQFIQRNYWSILYAYEIHSKSKEIEVITMSFHSNSFENEGIRAWLIAVFSVTHNLILE